MSGKRTYVSVLFSFFLMLCMGSESPAAMSGFCSSCHTMHNSQNGQPVVSLTYGSETDDAKEMLLIGSCLGCHAQGTANNIETIGTSDVPQVYHNDTSDLAAGNFKYIMGGGSNNKGHNILDFGIEPINQQPPGRRHNINGINFFTCAGSMGCHGTRGGISGQLYSLEGAHHNNAGPELSTADTVANSYRFLKSVRGYENNGGSRWENLDPSNHNEYFGIVNPPVITGFSSCHDASGLNAYPPDHTISGFCGTCHGYFHYRNSLGEDGVGDDNISPFLRHPTDVILPTIAGPVNTEYEAYTSYSVLAPVARTAVPSSISSVVTPGSDVVMCLSCHGAHATNFDDMLRWDYRSPNLTDALAGCSVCHTDKN